MSDEVVVEQITKDPIPEKKDSRQREKNPKKVAAGKKLAEYNKRAKEALAREMKREEALANSRQAENSPEETIKSESESQAWIPDLSFATVLSIVGIGFTVVDMFMRYYKNRIVDLSQVPTKEPPPSNIPIPKSESAVKTTPKIGMI